MQIVRYFLKCRGHDRFSSEVCPCINKNSYEDRRLGLRMIAWRWGSVQRISKVERRSSRANGMVSWGYSLGSDSGSSIYSILFASFMRFQRSCNQIDSMHIGIKTDGCVWWGFYDGLNHNGIIWCSLSSHLDFVTWCGSMEQSCVSNPLTGMCFSFATVCWAISIAHCDIRCSGGFRFLVRIVCLLWFDCRKLFDGSSLDSNAPFITEQDQKSFSRSYWLLLQQWVCTEELIICNCPNQKSVASQWRKKIV